VRLKVNQRAGQLITALQSCSQFIYGFPKIAWSKPQKSDDICFGTFQRKSQVHRCGWFSHLPLWPRSHSGFVPRHELAC